MASDPQTYADLQAAILSWMQDNTLAPTLPQIIALGERRLSRRLNVPDMEVSTTLAVTDGAVVLPDDLMELRAAYVAKDGGRAPLNEMTQADFNEGFTTESTGVPSRYTISGQNLYLRPYPDDVYAVNITYKQSLPPLSNDNPTNWLLTQHSDLYLYNSLATAEFFGWNDARAAQIKGLVDELIDEVTKVGRSKRYGVGPLVARPPVGDYSRRSPGFPSGEGGFADNDYLVDG